MKRFIYNPRWLPIILTVSCLSLPLTSSAETEMEIGPAAGTAGHATLPQDADQHHITRGKLVPKTPEPKTGTEAVQPPDNAGGALPDVAKEPSATKGLQ